jgi:L-lactate dehydrogenase (cytochrome)
MMDGGIRRGSDVLKAVALGATFVFGGRPFVYAAAIGGEAGVSHAINILSTEISRNMGLLGVNALSDLRSDRLLRLSGMDGGLNLRSLRSVLERWEGPDLAHLRRMSLVRLTSN